MNVKFVNNRKTKLNPTFRNVVIRDEYFMLRLVYFLLNVDLCKSNGMRYE